MPEDFDTLTAARAYRAAGFSLLPVKADGSKAPALSAWKALQQHPPTDAQLQQWFGGPAPHGIGLIHGQVSGHSGALDFDQPGLYSEFARLCNTQGWGSLLDSLPLVETPSGGHHLLYRCTQPGGGNTKLAETPDRKTLIETRAEGGYTLAPGSPAACHPAGLPYCFARGGPDTVPILTAAERSALHDLARVFTKYADPRSVVDAPRPTTPSTGTRPGDDFNLRGDLPGHLEQRGWRQIGSSGDKGLWQRPGKEGPGISATTNYANTGLFYVFSANAAPFEPQRAYTPFAAYTLLEHGGDFAQAARTLSAEGYGEPPPARDLTAPVRVLEETHWPQADPTMFHSLAGDIVRVLEPHTEADPVALLVQLLTAFGSAIGRRAHFTAEADQHFGNLFVVMVGISAKGRKGTSWGHIKKLFALAAPHWETDCIQSGLSSGEGLIWHIRDAVEKPVKNKTTGEVELETLDPGIEDKRLLIMESEYASVLRVAGRDGSTLSAILRDAWDRGRLQTMTKTNAAKATGAHVSVIGHVTAEELRRELSSTEAANGFANRFLWFCVRRSKELPEGGSLTDDALYPLTARLSEAIETGRQTDRMARDDNARTLWHAVYHDLSEGGPGLSGAVTSRAEAQTMRLALLYALLDGANCIRREHLTAALAVWEYVEASARYIFGDSLGDPVADDILRALLTAPDGLSRNDLRELFQRHQSSGRVGQALALLAQHRRAECTMQTDTGGRPAERWHAIRSTATPAR